MNDAEKHLMTVFSTALEIGSAAERQAYLDRACADDPALRVRVEALLLAHDRAGGFLGRTCGSKETGGREPSAESRPAAAPEVGTIVAGRYKLLERVGEGGMGEVWMAEQTEPVRRKVALKLIKPGMDSRQVLARFEAERQALALMDHPNIARVLDGGSTAAGQPFFVMELVKGVPITAYCDDQRLTLRQRLELFLPVCQAVQHAHQKGVIHRDIKPSNVLVAPYDGAPVPKVIDFGIAKAVDQPLTEKTLFTGLGAAVGTPEYMSPEQAQLNNKDIDTRSDVYSLGVLLYELLTGTTPLTRARLKGAALLEVLRLVREEDPPRPSHRLSTTEELPSIAAVRGVEPARLSKLMRGELDWIVMKALEKNRDRRYETANGLAMDLRRYLADEPVQAGPPTVVYRLRKFASRNKALLMTGAIVFLALIAGTAIATWQAVRASRAEELAQRRLDSETAARRRAQERSALAIEAIETFSNTVSSDPILQAPQFEGLRRSLLKPPLEFYRRLRKTLESGAGKDTDEQTRAGLASSYAGLAALTYEIGSYEDALRASTESRDLLRQLAGQRPNEPEHRLRLARTLNLIGRNSRLVGHNRLAGIRSYEEAAQILEGLVRAAPDDPLPRTDLAATYRAMADKERYMHLIPPARQHYRRARELYQDLARRQPAVPAHREGLARVFNGLAILERLTTEPAPPANRRTAVFDAIDRSCALWEALTREFPDSAEYRAGLARAVNSRGVAIWADQRITAAIAELERSRDLNRSLVERFPAVNGYREELGRTCNNLGRIYRQAGRPDDSAKRYTEARDLYDGLARENPTTSGFRMELANAWNSLGDLDLDAGRADQAVVSLQHGRGLLEGLAREEHGFGSYHCLLAINLFTLGKAQRASSRPRDSLETYRRAAAFMEEIDKTDSIAAYNVACCYALLGKSLAPGAESEVALDKAVATLSRAIALGARDLNHMKSDSDLDPLRSRPDFQLMMMDLAMPADPFVRAQ